VLVVGDSFVFGWGVEEHESLPGRLRSAHPQWDVRGAGVSGFAPDQQLLLLRRLGQSLRPDVIVCVSSRNDVYESASDMAYGLAKPQFVRDRDGVALVSLPGPQGWLAEHSLLWRAIDKLVWRWQFQGRPEVTDWSLVLALYRAMQREFAGADFVLVAATDELRPLTTGERPMVYLDLAEVLPRGGDWIFPQDTHWHAGGHARVAEAVAGAVAHALGQRGR
jgi:hypothetical protein